MAEGSDPRMPPANRLRRGRGSGGAQDLDAGEALGLLQQRVLEGEGQLVDLGQQRGGTRAVVTPLAFVIGFEKAV